MRITKTNLRLFDMSSRWIIYFICFSIRCTEYKSKQNGIYGKLMQFSFCQFDRAFICIQRYKTKWIQSTFPILDINGKSWTIHGSKRFYFRPYSQHATATFSKMSSKGRHISRTRMKSEHKFVTVLSQLWNTTCTPPKTYQTANNCLRISSICTASTKKQRKL